MAPIGISVPHDPPPVPATGQEGTDAYNAARPRGIPHRRGGPNRPARRCPVRGRKGITRSHRERPCAPSARREEGAYLEVRPPWPSAAATDENRPPLVAGRPPYVDRSGYSPFSVSGPWRGHMQRMNTVPGRPATSAFLWCARTRLSARRGSLGHVELLLRARTSDSPLGGSSGRPSHDKPTEGRSHGCAGRALRRPGRAQGHGGGLRADTRPRGWQG